MCLKWNKRSPKPSRTAVNQFLQAVGYEEHKVYKARTSRARPGAGAGHARATSARSNFAAKAKEASRIYHEAIQSGRDLTWKQAQQRAWGKKGGPAPKLKDKARSSDLMDEDRIGDYNPPPQPPARRRITPTLVAPLPTPAPAPPRRRVALTSTTPFAAPTRGRPGVGTEGQQTEARMLSNSPTIAKTMARIARREARGKFGPKGPKKPKTKRR